MRPLTVLLEENVMNAYLREAADKETELEAVLSSRLVNCIDHRSKHSMYLDESNLDELEKLLDGPLKSPEDLVKKIRSMISVRLRGPGIRPMDVPISVQLLQRIKDRCYRTPLEAYAKDAVIDGLERHFGIK